MVWGSDFGSFLVALGRFGDVLGCFGVRLWLVFCGFGSFWLRFGWFWGLTLEIGRSVGKNELENRQNWDDLGVGGWSRAHIRWK